MRYFKRGWGSLGWITRVIYVVLPLGFLLLGIGDGKPYWVWAVLCLAMYAMIALVIRESGRAVDVWSLWKARGYEVRYAHNITFLVKDTKDWDKDYKEIVKEIDDASH